MTLKHQLKNQLQNPSSDKSLNPSAIAGRAIFSAVTIWFLWAALVLTSLIYGDVFKDSALWIVLRFLLAIFLFTGLFITAHEAMHGLAAPGYPKLNRFIGRLAIFSFAGFSYDAFLPKHHEHHDFTASAKDPDYHDGRLRSLFGWYFVFMSRHVSWRPFAFFTILFVMAYSLGASPLVFVLAWPIPALLSSFQLFYFGTYLPHRETSEPYNHLRSRSNEYPVWLSFLTCYHFGYHYEHHLAPSVPWWKLPIFRQRDLQRVRIERLTESSIERNSSGGVQ